MDQDLCRQTPRAGGALRAWALAGLSLALGLSLAACSVKPAPRPGVDGRLPADVTPLSYSLTLSIDPRQERFSGETGIKVRLAKPTQSFWIHGKDLKVVSATVTPKDGAAITAEYADKGDGLALVTLSKRAPAGEATLSFVYDAPFNDNAAGLYHTRSEGEAYAVTQFQAIDARRAFPSFDQPEFKTPFNVTILAPQGDTVIANTKSLRTEPAAAGLTRHVFTETKPLPTYLVAFAVGPYDVIDGPVLPATMLRKSPLPLRAVAAKGKAEQARYALSQTAALITYFETYFDAPYPYDKLDFIAAPEFSAGAMENAGAIVYAENRILTAKDAPVAQLRRVLNTHAHELAHQWFGDLVTPRWWDDIWLNEAFATWMAYKATAAVAPQGGGGVGVLLPALAAMNEDSLSTARRIREPIVKESDIEDAFDRITYDKGGGVLSMAESYLGEDAFRNGVRVHMKRFAYGVATSQDFFESLGQGSQRPEIVPALASFTDRNHVPLVDARLDCPTDGASPRVRLTQSTFQPPGPALEKRMWTIPVCVSAYGLTGSPVRSCTIMTEAAATVSLFGACPAFISANADGAGYYRVAMDERGWTSALAGFRRLSTGEKIALMDSMRAGFATGKTTAALVLRSIEAGAASTDPAVRSKAVDVAASLAPLARDEAEQRAYATWVRTTFARRGGDAGARATPAERAASAAVAEIVALYGRDPALRARLLAGARNVVGLGGAAAPADLRAIALMVGVADGGPEMFDKVRDLALKTTDAQLRSEALAALAHLSTPEGRKAFGDLVVSEAVTGSTMRRAMMATQSYPWTAPLGLEVLTQHFDALVARMPGGLAAQGAPAFARSLCSNEDRKALNDLFAAKAKAGSGYERTLSQVSEGIERCAAERDGPGKDLMKSLSPAR